MRTVMMFLWIILGYGAIALMALRHFFKFVFAFVINLALLGPNLFMWFTHDEEFRNKVTQSMTEAARSLPQVFFDKFMDTFLSGGWTVVRTDRTFTRYTGHGAKVQATMMYELAPTSLMLFDDHGKVVAKKEWADESDGPRLTEEELAAIKDKPS